MKGECVSRRRGELPSNANVRIVMEGGGGGNKQNACFIERGKVWKAARVYLNVQEMW